MRTKTIAVIAVACLLATLAITGCNEAVSTEKIMDKVPAPACKKAATEQIKEDSKLIVVSNKATYDLSEPVLKFIETRGVPVLRLTADKFDAYKSSKYIVLLGGPNASEGVGCFAKQLLSSEEQSEMTQMGNKKMYLKTNKWADEQYILVFAGFDDNAAYRVLVNSKDQWWCYISSWFNIELTHEEVYGY